MFLRALFSGAGVRAESDGAAAAAAGGLDDGAEDDAYAVKAAAAALAPAVAAGTGAFFSTFGFFLPALGMVKKRTGWGELREGCLVG